MKHKTRLEIKLPERSDPFDYLTKLKKEGKVINAHVVKWQELLKRMKQEHIKRTAPNFFELSGGYRMQIKPYTDLTSNGLCKCIVDFITHSGGYANRISTTGTMRKINGQMKWTTGNSNKGAPDIRFIYQGRSGDVEIKIGKDRISDAQIKEMDRITAAGGLVFVARDFPSFLNWWQTIGFSIPEYKPYKMNNNVL